MRKILILKMGYSETLDPETSKIVSLGDILRCSVILEPLKEKFPDCRITWVVAKEGVELLTGNEMIDRILVWDEFLPFVLMKEQYDVVINLEKISGICALTSMIDAWEKLGFRFNSRTGEYDTYMQSTIAKDYIENKNITREIWQKILVEMVGGEWKEQEYSLGYRPKTKEEFDVGFNYTVGSKWPYKAMPVAKWEELEKKLDKDGLSVSWQEGKTNLHEYIDWINKCNLLITNDSLGLHIALALKKKMIVLFGPTSGEEVYLYGRATTIGPKSGFRCDRLPCYDPRCRNDVSCMAEISVNEVYEAVKKMMG